MVMAGAPIGEPKIVTDGTTFAGTVTVSAPQLPGAQESAPALAAMVAVPAVRPRTKTGLICATVATGALFVLQIRLSVNDVTYAVASGTWGSSSPPIAYSRPSSEAAASSALCPVTVVKRPSPGCRRSSIAGMNDLLLQRSAAASYA